MFGNRPHFIEESELLDYQEEQELTLGHSTDLYGTISERDVYMKLMDHEGYTYPIILGSKSGKFGGELDDLAVMEWNGLKKRMTVCGKTSCLVGDSNIVLGDGSVQSLLNVIEDFEKGINKEVLALDETTLRLTKKPILKCFRNGKKPVFSIQLSNGRSLTSTNEHKYYTMRGWMNLAELAVGDYIAIPDYTNLDFYETSSDEELCFLAYMLADGCVTNHIGFTNESKSIITEFDSCVYHLNPNATIRHSPTSKNPNVFQIYPSPAKFFKKYFENLGLYRKASATKFVPDLVKRASKRQIGLFLNRYWACDGWIVYNPPKTKRRSQREFEVACCSISHRLAEDVVYLLSRLGVYSIIRTKNMRVSGKPYAAYIVEVTGSRNVLNFFEAVGLILGKESKSSELYEALKINSNKRVSTLIVPLTEVVFDKAGKPKLNIPGGGGHYGSYKHANDSWTHFNWHPSTLERWLFGGQFKTRGVGWGRVDKPLLKQILEYNNCKEGILHNLANGDLLWTQVNAIVPRGEAEVFDLNVEAAHSYIANGLIVHNSGKSIISMWIAGQMKNIYNLPFVGVDRFGEYYSHKKPLEGEHIWKLKRLGLSPRGLGDSCTFLKPAFLFTPKIDKADYLFGIDIDTVHENIESEMDARSLIEQLLGIEEGSSSQDERYMASRELLVEKLTKEHCESFKEVQASLQSDMDRILDAQSGRKGGYYEKLSFSPALKRKVDSSLSSGTIGHEGTVPETEGYACLKSYEIISPKFTDYLKNGNSLMLETTITGAAKMRSVEAIEALMIESLTQGIRKEDIGKFCYLNEEARVAVPSGTEVGLLKTAYINWSELGRKFGCAMIDVTQTISKLDKSLIEQNDCFITSRITNRKDLRLMEDRGVDPLVSREIIAHLPYNHLWPVKRWCYIDEESYVVFTPYCSFSSFHQEKNAFAKLAFDELFNSSVGDSNDF